MYGILELQRKIRSGEKSRDSRSAAAGDGTRFVWSPGQRTLPPDKP
jgi:hypothetical protein